MNKIIQDTGCQKKEKLDFIYTILKSKTDLKKQTEITF